MPKRKYGMILVSLSVALVLAMLAGTSLGALGFQPGLVLQALSAPSDPANTLVSAALQLKEMRIRTQSHRSIKQLTRLLTARNTR